MVYASFTPWSGGNQLSFFLSLCGRGARYLCFALQDIPLTDRHHYEPWFHGRLPGGRDLADSLLQQNSWRGDATFLVRESDAFPGQHTLSFW